MFPGIFSSGGILLIFRNNLKYYLRRQNSSQTRLFEKLFYLYLPLEKQLSRKKVVLLLYCVLNYSVTIKNSFCW